MKRKKKRSGFVTFLFLLAVAGLSFLVGMVGINFIMAFSVKHGEEILVPQLKGLALEEAERVAREVNLRLEKVGEQFNVSVPPGFVLSQSPPAARRVKQGRRISVIVSGGTETVRVPEVVGGTFRGAIVLLDGAGLEVGEVARCSSRVVEPGTVIASNPPGDEILEKGSAVDLLVSLGPQRLEFVMSDLVGEDEDLVRRQMERLGMTVLVSRELRHWGRVGPQIVVDHEPSEGYMVSEGDTVALIVGSRRPGVR